MRTTPHLSSGVRRNAPAEVGPGSVMGSVAVHIDSSDTLVRVLWCAKIGQTVSAVVCRPKGVGLAKAITGFTARPVSE